MKMFEALKQQALDYIESVNNSTPETFTDDFVAKVKEADSYVLLQSTFNAYDVKDDFEDILIGFFND